MLGRLGLELLGRSQIWHESQVYAGQILLRHFPLELPYGLKEWLGLHVADGAADFSNDDVELAGLAEKQHPSLDFISDVGNDLDRLAEICALALPGYDGMVNFSGSDIVCLGHMNAQESLVMSEVEVCLRTVIRNVALAVLVGIQCTRVYVDVGVKFLDSDS